MSDQPLDPAPETPETQEQTHAPDGWELACLGILRSEFGRRRSRALKKALMQLSAEEAWLEAQAEAARMKWWKKIRGVFATPGFRFAFSAAIILVLATLTWVFFPNLLHSGSHSPTASALGCKIADSLNAHWSGTAAQLKTGDMIPGDQLRLESGVVELAFASGAKAAIEGPAELKVTDRNSVELRQGKLSADVPHQASGFAVHTPNATVIDLGTRFGINANSKDSSEVDVFEGKVHVTQGRDAAVPDNEWDLTRNMAMVLDKRGGVTAAAAPETAFPQLSRAFLVRPANCGFDAAGAFRIGGFPAAFGTWSGAAFALTGPVGDVRPVQGSGMLRFLAPPRQPGNSGDSEVWQVVDLHPAKEFMSRSGVVDLKAWVQFNRVPGDVHTADKFNLSIAAFKGAPEDASALWAHRKEVALAVAEKELASDNDPKTWERVEVATTVSADADFVVLAIRAIAPRDAAANPFPGHFADLIDAKVCVPLGASTVTTSR